MKASFAVGIMDRRGRVFYRYTVGNESQFASGHNADVASATDLFEGMYPDAAALREFLYAPHARRQAETARDLPAYIGAAVRESPCKVALLHTGDGYVAWDVRGERARRWQERCVHLLVQATGMLRDARGALQDGSGMRAMHSRENARRAAGTACEAIRDAQELVVEAGFGFGATKVLWRAQETLNATVERRLNRTLDRGLQAALHLADLSLEEQREGLVESTRSALWLPGSSAWLFHAAEILELLDTLAGQIGRAAAEVRAARDTAEASERTRPRRGAELRDQARARARAALAPGYGCITLVKHFRYADSGLEVAIGGLNRAVERVAEERVIRELVRLCGIAVEAADAAIVAIGRARRAAAVSFEATTAVVVAGR